MPATPAETVTQRLTSLALPAQGPAPAGDTASRAAQLAAAASQAPEPRAVARTLPVLPVARLRIPGATIPDRSAGSPAGATAGQGAASSPAIVGPTTPPAAVARPAGSPVSLPILGYRPLRPAVVAQRDVARRGDAADVPAAAPAPVVARWTAAGDLPATVQTLPPPGGAFVDDVPLRTLEARDATAPGTTTLAREIAVPSGDGVSGAARQTIGAAGAAAVRDAGPAGGVADVRRRPLGRVPGTPGPTAQRTLSLAHPPGPAAAMQPQPMSEAAVQRIVADAVTSSARPVQASPPAPLAASLPGVTATPVVQRVEGTAPEVGGKGEGRSEAELDELARDLFGRIRTHLRSEVIHEREAKGLTFDAF
jgi:hypothetical protein